CLRELGAVGLLSSPGLRNVSMAGRRRRRVSVVWPRPCVTPRLPSPRPPAACGPRFSMDRGSGARAERRKERRAGKTGLSSVLAPLRPEALELGHRLQVLRPARGPFDGYELLQAEAAAGDPEGLHLDRGAEEVLVASAPDDLSEDVDVAEARRQGEVQPSLDRRLVPAERQPAGGAAKVGRERGESGDEPAPLPPAGTVGR